MWALAERQHRAVSHDQLCALGFSDGAIRHRIARGDLHMRHRGVYAVGPPTLTTDGEAFAAVLAAGAGSAISHVTALALWRLATVDRAELIHVSVASARHPGHGDGYRVHRRTPMPPVRECRGIRVVEPLHALLETPVEWPLSRLEAAVNEADKVGLLRIDTALAQLGELSGKRGVRKLRQALNRHTVTDSDLERCFLRLVRRAGLPMPETQAVIGGLRVDFYWPRLGLVVETDGLTYHRTPAQQVRDRRRDQILTAAGLTVLRFTNAQVRREPAQVVTTLRAVATRRLAG